LSRFRGNQRWLTPVLSMPPVAPEGKGDDAT